MIDITDYLWIIWLSFIVICVIIELLTLEFTFLMIAFGSIAGLGAELLGWEWWVQILLAAIVSVLLLFTIRPLLLKKLRTGEDPTPSNIAALLGMRGRVVSPIVETGGLVKLANGETWTARIASSTEQRTIETGEDVLVTVVDGATVVVVPVERATV
ncbi:NfeD family protein [Agromyces atrinae]|uniref:Membrane protein implicated in regulation of membrane protease activity n=1 Tax=Agromyces atrinae TaxID=592376 RepID=A0A4Q2M3C2_9MICO|nr:NfeD family protein [Agromyces atrinae]NYD66130.1 membrane protein implicated in regulation of membrane protease activity [Agromyces atrinae]RXZ86474.1 NfeD family protein [Agromyces atrinae]